ncbi:MAG: ThuA domain-containing protein [Salinivenus sp.]
MRRSNAKGTRPARPVGVQGAIALGILLLIGTLWPPMAPAQEQATPALEGASVLVFSKTNGYRHASIPDGHQALQELGAEHGFDVESTEDSTVFRPERLSDYDAVVFLNTSGDFLGPDGQAAFRDYIQEGGAYVGIHSASAGEYDWDWYGRLVGAVFDEHPEIQEATVRVEDSTHVSTHMLPTEWVREDEWYNFRSNPRDSVEVLLTLDESTYEGGTMGEDHPIAWYHTFEGGRAWYTALGHTKASYEDPLFRQHVMGGLRWAVSSSDAHNE